MSCRGAERGEILKRWVILLKEVERLKLSQSEDKEITPEQNSGASEDVNDIRKKISTVSLLLLLLAFDSSFQLKFQESYGVSCYYCV